MNGKLKKLKESTSEASDSRSSGQRERRLSKVISLIGDDNVAGKGEHDQRDKTRKKLNEDNHGEEQIATEHQNAYTSIYDASRLLQEVKDVRDELGILRFLLQHQSTVWSGLSISHGRMMWETTEATNGSTNRNENIGRRQSGDIIGYNEDIDEMEKTANRIHASVRVYWVVERRKYTDGYADRFDSGP